jgi:molecular chaperone Hsp33
MDSMIKGLSQDGTLLVVGLVNTGMVEWAKTLHDAYPTAAAALGRVLSGATLLSSTMKNDQRTVLQVTGDGPLGAVVAEADSQGRVRGYVREPHVHLPSREGKLDVGRAIGKGFLTVIKDLGLKDPYRGSVPLQTGEIASDLAYYLSVSEQIPAAVSLGVYVETDNTVKASGGFLMQALPGLGEDILDHLETRLKAVPPVSSMILSGLGPRELVQEASGLPVDVLEEREVRFHCPCDRSRVLAALAVLGKQEIRDLIDKGEVVNVECKFCKSRYTVPQDELVSLLKSIEAPH